MVEDEMDPDKQIFFGRENCKNDFNIKNIDIFFTLSSAIHAFRSFMV